MSREPANAAALFTMSELLVLGGGAPAAFQPWGTYACPDARLPVH